MVTPPRKGGIDPHILAAADLGVDEIYTIGGAQAIAALKIRDGIDSESG